MTREEVAGAVARGYGTTANMHKELDADLVTGITNEVMALLQSLSQEAVRDEALEEAAKVCDAEAELRYARHEKPLPGDDDPMIQAHKGVTANTIGRAIRALKREPNAAAQVDGLARRWVDHPDRPAPAAPDVAEMVKRLEVEAAYHELHGFIETKLLLRQAAALLARLGPERPLSGEMVMVPRDTLRRIQNECRDVISFQVAIHNLLSAAEASRRKVK